ncbi:hypothetical protein D187_004132 [Cystobacter fuscus DSM 2262]|uniref:Uncharacterized protein n=1 Tax=Cystobacter fuscus (strain ATCC 25194 / DSM 2262 / NBRC 100088 / M29) TaxID=1242864 RepID=S9P592_CYSF2|nr:hypothetical protein [Cystobacter fuscus]EPX58376.1 hypothetical protein D187_004132 [Cystobacter fuscus DSM 2262]
MSARLTFDDSLWPLVIFRPAGVMTNGQFEEFLTRSASYLERGEPYVSITDARQAGMPPLDQLRRLSEWLDTNSDRLREQVLCNAIIVTSAAMRLSMSLVFHLKPQPMPHRAMSDMESALEYALDKLRESGRVADAERIQRHFAASSAHVG